MLRDLFLMDNRTPASYAAILAMVLGFFVAAQPANAQNLVQNPSFESNTNGGSTDFWSRSAGSFTGYAGNAHTGNFSAYFGNGDIAGSGIISQSIATTPMTDYLVSFFLLNSGGPSNDFLATFGGQVVLALHDVNAFGYTEYSATITATSTDSILAFSGGSGSAAFQVDDVSVESAPAPIPGAGMISSAAGLIFAFGAAIRNRRRRI
jgi:hypothetical protein